MSEKRFINEKIITLPVQYTQTWGQVGVRNKIMTANSEGFVPILYVGQKSSVDDPDLNYFPDPDYLNIVPVPLDNQMLCQVFMLRRKLNLEVYKKAL